MTASAALEARGVRKRYEKVEVLRGVDLRVEPGTVHGLLGPNGAGKTTLLRIALGLAKPDEGQVTLLGDQPATLGVGLPEGVAGFVENPGFYPYLTARDNLRLLRRLDARGGPRSDVDSALERVGLEGAATKRVRGFSAGMRQRLSLAAALLRAPRLLLLDEPTSALDPSGARRLREGLRALAKEGVAVLFSSHAMAEVEALCDAITVLHRGEVVFTGTTSELQARAPSASRTLRTSDDARALAIAADHPGVNVAASEGRGLLLSGDLPDLDRYLSALGKADVAVRSLEAREGTLEALFLQLTEDGR